MSTKNSAGINQFMMVIIVTIIFLTGLAAITLKGIWQAINDSRKINDQVNLETQLKTNELDKAYKLIQDRKNVPLDLK